MAINNVVSIGGEIDEQIPKGIVERLFRDKVRVRIALAIHPVKKEVAPVVSYKEFAEAFSYDPEAVRKMISRSMWLKKYSVTVIMSATDGKFYKTLCITEEAALGVLMKLSPNMCKDREVADHIEALQEEMAIMLRNAFTEFRAISGNGQDEAARTRASKERIILLQRVDQIKDHDLKNTALDELEHVFGKKFPRPKQMELNL